MQGKPAGQVTIVFGGMDEFEHVDDPIHKDVSAATRVDDALFVCCDETSGVDRLTYDGTRGPTMCTSHWARSSTC